MLHLSGTELGTITPETYVYEVGEKEQDFSAGQQKR